MSRFKVGDKIRVPEMTFTVKGDMDYSHRACNLVMDENGSFHFLFLEAGPVAARVEILHSYENGKVYIDDDGECMMWNGEGWTLSDGTKTHEGYALLPVVPFGESVKEA